MTGTKKSETTHRIFLSYAHIDSQRANVLRHLLSRRRDTSVFTTNMLSAGEDWQTKLKEEISNCDTFILLVSKDSFDSKWVLHELGAAWAMDKEIIAVVTEDTLPLNMPVEVKDLQVVKFDDLQDPEALARILPTKEEMASAT